jgi:hypothetical protein
LPASDGFHPILQFQHFLRQRAEFLFMREDSWSRRLRAVKPGRGDLGPHARGAAARVQFTSPQALSRVRRRTDAETGEGLSVALFFISRADGIDAPCPASIRPASQALAT